MQYYKYMFWTSAMLFTISRRQKKVHRLTKLSLSLNLQPVFWNFNIFNILRKGNKERKMMVVLIKYVLVIVMTLILRVLYDSIWCYYVTPRRIKKLMERQGITGPNRRLLTGNIIDISKMVSYSVSDHCSSIHHNIVPRLLPHYVAWSKQYGTYPGPTFLDVRCKIIFFTYVFVIIKLKLKFNKFFFSWILASKTLKPQIIVSFDDICFQVEMRAMHFHWEQSRIWDLWRSWTFW